MKRFTFVLVALLALVFQVNAQQMVSTTPSNRNVILEEFTGRNCGYCPDGHRIANQIMADNPGRVWAINVHAGGYAPTSYPNFITPDGTTIHNGFTISGYPTGVVNRSTASGQSRSVWESLSNTQLSQAAECNVAGLAIINPETRVASITVEVYYTGNSAYDQNFLTVAMLQDSVMGSQSGASSNPAQVVNGTYCHMHILRDVITESAWGDAIAPTTQGTLITRTYEYQIPEVIGSPNGVDVILDHVFFLAWVSERQQGSAYRPILNACELVTVQGSSAPVSPCFLSVQQEDPFTCTQSKVVKANIINVGVNDMTSMTLNADFQGSLVTVNWEGNLPQFGTTTVDIPFEAPFGQYDMNIDIVSVNGQPFSNSTSCPVSCTEWIDYETEEDEVTLRLEFMQDKFGNQDTWEFVSDDGTVLASGGPYQLLAGGNSTQLHVESVVVPAGACVRFSIYDSGENGICCNYGQGYYILKDAQGNVILGDQDDGDFGSGVTHLISMKSPAPQVTLGETEVFINSYTDADFVSVLSYNGYPDEVGFEYRKVTSSTATTVVGVLNEFKKIMASVNDLEPSSIYMVKSYAVVNGTTYYGPDLTFNSWATGVEDHESSLKLFPNPASDFLTVQGEMTQVKVFNAVGQCLYSQQVNGNEVQISLEGFANGLYFLHVENNGEVVTRKFSVSR